MTLKIIKDWIGGSEAEKFITSSEDGLRISLRIDDCLYCYIELGSLDNLPILFIYIPLIILPDSSKDRSQLMRELLSKNSFNLETGIASIGLDPRNDYIFLGHQMEFPLYDEDTFHNYLSDIIENGRVLNHFLRDLSPPIKPDNLDPLSLSHQHVRP